MLSKHEPVESNRTGASIDTPTSASQAEDTRKTGRAGGLRNRLSLRRHDGSPKSKSRNVSAQSWAKDHRTASGQSGGFLLDNPRNRTVVRGGPSTGEQLGQRVRLDPNHAETLRRHTPSPRLSRISADHDFRSSPSSRGDNANGSGLGIDPWPQAPHHIGKVVGDDAALEVQTGRNSSLLSNNPAEIVDLALSLSAYRKKRSGFVNPPISSGSFSQSRISSQNMDFLPTGLPAPTAATNHPDSTGSQTNQNGHAANPDSRTISLADTLAEQPQTQDDIRVESLHGLIPMSGGRPSTASGGIKPSQATLKRVERAKAVLESAYHYRRVLQQLPELPRPSTTGQLPGENEGPPQQLSGSMKAGRSYNPLQYIRNRRIRQRDGSPLDPAKDGWENVDRVRSWVDIVTEESAKDPMTSTSIKALPPLPNDVLPHQVSQHASTDADLMHTKSFRPRADWSTSPAEMLADVYWTHSSDNRYRLLDRHGNRLFARARQAPPANEHNALVTNDKHSTRMSWERSSLEVPRPMSQSSSFHDNNPSDRGRQRHQHKTLWPSEHVAGSSVERQRVLPRGILRSISPSLRSDRDDPLMPSISRGMQSFDDKDMPELLLLRQQLRLLSQDTSRINRKEEDGRQQNASLGQQYSRTPDDADIYSTDDAKDMSSDRRAGLSIRGRRPLGSSTNHDSATSSDHESMQSPKPLRKPPDIFIDAEEPQKTQPKLLDSPFLSSTAQAGEGRSSLEVFSDASGFMSEPGNKGKARPKHSDRTDSHMNPSPSASPLRPREGQRKNVALSTGISPRSLYTRRDSESKLRGLIRGSKISELMSAPVARVGDLIWRRADAEPRSRSTSTSSQERHALNYKDAPEDADDGTADAVMSDSDSLREEKATKRPYHVENLPVFRSPFRGSNPSSTEDVQDHISRQQEALRAKRSNSRLRFEKLAPPELDLRSISASPSRPSTPNGGKREGSDGYQQRGNKERRAAIYDQGAGEPPDFSQDPSGPSRGSGRMSLDRWRPGSYMFTMAKLDAVASTGKITKREISRLQTMMTSCAIYSNEMVRWAAADHFRNLDAKSHSRPAASTVKYLQPPATPTGLQSGKALVRDIGRMFGSMREAVGKFSEETVNDLHSQVQSLHKELSEDLTGAARSAERAADELGSQLATDSTLEIKRLNETIDNIMRRRRRRTRWLRRMGFSMLEWTVLALMWWVWLLVVLYRLAKGSVKGVYWTVRWLLWL